MVKVGKTAFQKIIDGHLVNTLEDGRMVLKLDWVWCHEITTPNAILDMESRGCDVVFNPNKIKVMIDHVSPSKDTDSAIQARIVRNWSKKHGIEFLDVGRNGVCHAVIPENGWIRPGQIGIMGDSHTCTHGAFGAFTAGVGTTELENGLITGLWICPPQKVIRVNFNGELPSNVFAKDLVLMLINKIGVKGATNSVLEFGGDVVKNMNMEGRMTITNMSVEAGATSGMMPFDEIALKYLEKSIANDDGLFGTNVANFLNSNSDKNAKYDQVINIDVSNMAPVMTFDFSPGDVTEVAGLAGKKVDQVYIGSCTNGRISDLRVAAGVIANSGWKIADDVRCIIVPATQRVYEQALEEGLIEIFIKSGCHVSGPSCGACLGMSCGVIAPGEVCVSTTNRNFRGRMGKDGMVHLASPATAAITAVKGVIAKPDKGLCDMVDEFFIGGFASARPTAWLSKEFEKPDYYELLSKIGGNLERDFSGKPFYLGSDNIDTDQIIPAKYLTETDKSVFGKHCLEDAEIPADDRAKLCKSQILVAGENFGCGSSREHAPWALAAAGIRCVIAKSFARIFQNNMLSNGLLCITLSVDDMEVLMNSKPERIEIDIDGSVSWKIGGTEIVKYFPISEYEKGLVRNGGSLGYMIDLASRYVK